MFVCICVFVYPTVRVCVCKPSKNLSLANRRPRVSCVYHVEKPFARELETHTNKINVEIFFTSEEILATSVEIVATKGNIRYHNGKIRYFKDD